MRSVIRRVGLSVVAFATLGASAVVAADTIRIGLVAALSGQSAASGEAITRGLTLAINELNANGGVLGRDVELVRRDDESNPGRGVAAARELIYRQNVDALFGGIDTPVSLALVPLANQEGVPFMGVWAAGTGITRNGADPNYVFRVSAVDIFVDYALVDYAHERHGATNLGLMLINNPWGESNEDGLVEAAEAHDDVSIAGIEKFDGSDVDMVSQLTRLQDAGADTIVLVSNVAPAAQMIRSMDRMGWDVPVVSHWGISGGRFTELAGPTAEKVHFVQTYSFFGDQSERGARVLDTLVRSVDGVDGPADVIAPVGTANAYDAMLLLAAGMEQAGSTDGDAVRQALEELEAPVEGLIKTYESPFSADNHDALGADDYIMVRFDGDQIVPVD